MVKHPDLTSKTHCESKVSEVVLARPAEDVNQIL